jgi:hypothetical protein
MHMLTYRQYGEKGIIPMRIDLNEYLGFEGKRHSTKYFVAVKIEVLYDLCVLCRHGNEADPLEEAVRAILTTCKTERAMNNCLHDVIFNDKPIKKLVAERGGAC